MRIARGRLEDSSAADSNRSMQLWYAECERGNKRQENEEFGMSSGSKIPNYPFLILFCRRQKSKPPPVPVKSVLFWGLTKSGGSPVKQFIASEEDYPWLTFGHPFFYLWLKISQPKIEHRSRLENILELQGKLSSKVLETTKWEKGRNLTKHGKSPVVKRGLL